MGRVVRNVIVVSRINEGEMTLNTKSAVSTTTLDVANMVVVNWWLGVVTVVSSKSQLKDEKKIRKKRG